MRISRILSVLLFALPAGAAASPFPCPPGMAEPPGTSGLCCWIGQRADPARHECMGEPKCPRGMTRVSGGCEPRVVVHKRVDRKSRLVFIQMPGGSFFFGCEHGDACAPDEGSGEQLQVKPFWIGQTEVTAAAFERCVKAGSCQKPTSLTPPECNYGRRAKYPMNCITWHEAGAFCHWIGGRIPTADEWEYAAKSGQSLFYPWGDDPPTGKLANFCDANCTATTKSADQDDGYANSAPVGSYPKGATRYGLLDMAGNVWEWTSSEGPDRRQLEIRGGAWDSIPWVLRNAHRAFANPTQPRLNLGFRCVK